MTTPADVRWLLGEAEAFLRAGDAYGAVSRGSAALRRAASIHSPEGAEVQHEAELAFERFQAAAEAMRANVERRNALHVANEHRAAGISA